MGIPPYSLTLSFCEEEEEGVEKGAHPRPLLRAHV